MGSRVVEESVAWLPWQLCAWCWETCTVPFSFFRGGSCCARVPRKWRPARMFLNELYYSGARYVFFGVSYC